MFESWWESNVAGQVRRYPVRFFKSPSIRAAKTLTLSRVTALVSFIMSRTTKRQATTFGKSRSLVQTETTECQEETELECEPFYVNLRTFTPSQLDHLRQVGLLPPLSSSLLSSGDDIVQDDDDQAWEICLLYQKHAAYLHRVFETSTTPLAASFVSLDASHPWMIYWCLQGCDLLLDDPHLPTDSSLIPHNLLDVVHYLEQCWKTTAVYLDPEVVEQDVILCQVAQDSNLSLDKQHQRPVALTGGGFGGGPGQMPHCATTYASVLSLCIIATTTTSNKPTNADASAAAAAADGSCHSSVAAWNLLERIRPPLYIWLVALYQPDGGFAMHIDGEVDVRASYIALCCTKLLGLLSAESVLVKSNKALDFIASCQTYEGGFGSEPGSEAHSGYAFCAMAALQFLLQFEQEQSSSPITTVLSRFDLTSLRDWLARRQMSYEGGFSGRTNKLVDGCYSFWQGGSICILEHWLSPLLQQQAQAPGEDGMKVVDYDPWLLSWGHQTASSTTDASQPSTPSAATTMDRPLLLMDQAKLQRYILLCCQDAHGGLRDKPSKGRDFYHSCYVLSGLSVSQSQVAPSLLLVKPQPDNEQQQQRKQHETETEGDAATTTKERFGHCILSRVHTTHPCYNIRVERVRKVLQHFHQRPVFRSSSE